MAETATPPPAPAAQVPMPDFLGEIITNTVNDVKESNAVQRAEYEKGRGTPTTPPIAPTKAVETPKPAEASKAGEPPKPAPETKPDPKATVDLDALADAETLPRTSADWNARKAAQKERLTKAQKERDDYKAKWETIQKEHEALKSRPMPPEFEAIQKERDELSDRLKLEAVTRHPDFVKHFDGRVAEQEAIAKQQFGEDIGKKLISLAKMEPSEYRDGKIDELLVDLPSFKQAQVGAILNTMAQIDQQKQNVIVNAKAKYDEMQKHETSQRETMMKNARSEGEKMFNSLLSKRQDKDEGSALFQTKADDAEWNKAVESRVDYARKLIFDQLKPDSVIEAAFNAAAYPSIVEHAKTLSEENATLKEQIAKLTASAPNLAPSPTPKPAARNGTHFNPPAGEHGWTPQTIQDGLVRSLVETARE